MCMMSSIVKIERRSGMFEYRIDLPECEVFYAATVFPPSEGMEIEMYDRYERCNKVIRIVRVICKDGASEDYNVYGEYYR